MLEITIELSKSYEAGNGEVFKEISFREPLFVDLQDIIMDLAGDNKGRAVAGLLKKCAINRFDADIDKLNFKDTADVFSRFTESFLSF